MRIVIPNEEVLRSFSKIFIPLQQAIQSNACQIVALTEARDRLLPKLMSGRMEV